MEASLPNLHQGIESTGPHACGYYLICYHCFFPPLLENAAMFVAVMLLARRLKAA